MLISLIAAVAENGLIGKDNKLPWHLPADLHFFKKTTLGHPIIMGRKNFESIGKVLPGRTNIVLTRNASFAEAENLKVAHSLEEAFEIARETGTDECFVIGGAEIYKEALPLCQKLYITKVHGIFEGNTFMPEFEKDFRKISSVSNLKDERNVYDYDFEIFIPNSCAS
ncbi:MAG: dihydrofolate reductase [Fibromonadaceae bacterium]|nr:dihydrofolate reductase [Fibromonadaceae bacterium]